MFLGTHAPRLDDKGRLILPAKFREQLADGLVITRGQERCLYVFPTAEFERIADQLRQAPVTSKQARDYLRVFLSGASDEMPDKQGRITIPPALRTYAGLTRDCRRDRRRPPGRDLGRRGLGEPTWPSRSRRSPSRPRRWCPASSEDPRADRQPPTVRSPAARPS